MKSTLIRACAIAFFAASFSSCDKVKDSIVEPATFTLTGMDATVLIPVVTDLDQHTGFGSATFVYNLDSVVRKKSFEQLGIANIQEFRVSSCTFTIENPDSTNNFANFENATGSFSTNANPTFFALGQVTGNPDTYSPTLTLTTDHSTNLRSYIPASGAISINYSIGGKMRRVTNKELRVQVHVSYDVVAKP